MILKHQPTVIEFVGLPAVGKTSLSRALASRLGVRSISVRQPSSRMVLSTPFTSLAELAAIARCSTQARRTLFNLRLAGFSSSESYAAKGSSTTLIEEGWVHEFWRALFLNRSIRVSDYGTLFRRRRNLVVLKADSPTRYRRIISRPLPGPINGILANSGPSGLEWRRSITTYQEVIDECLAHSRSISLDTTKPFAESLGALETWVAQLEA